MNDEGITNKKCQNTRNFEKFHTKCLTNQLFLLFLLFLILLHFWMKRINTKHLIIETLKLVLKRFKKLKSTKPIGDISCKTNYYCVICHVKLSIWIVMQMSNHKTWFWSLLKYKKWLKCHFYAWIRNWNKSRKIAKSLKVQTFLTTFLNCCKTLLWTMQIWVSSN